MIDVYVVYGQGGIATSGGMYLLSKRIAALSPHLNVTTHSWYEHLDLIDGCILVGYSLGANSVTWNAANGKLIRLAICYDPSIKGVIVEPRNNIKRLLLYHNSGPDIVGHLKFLGPQVEITEVSLPHLAICYSEALHQKTLKAIQESL